MNLTKRVTKFFDDLTAFNDRWAFERHGETYEKELAELKARKTELLAEIRSRDKKKPVESRVRPASTTKDAMRER